MARRRRAPLSAAAAAEFLFTLWLEGLGAAWVWELLIPTIAAAALAATRPGRTWGAVGGHGRRWSARPPGGRFARKL